MLHRRSLRARFPELVAQLSEPAQVGSHAGVTRYLYEHIYLRRPDLQRAFPDVAGDDAARLVDWAWWSGRDEVPIPFELLPPLPDGRPPPAEERSSNRQRPARKPAGTGVNVVGYLHAQHGLGEAARLVIRGLDTAGVPVLPVAQDLLYHPDRLGYAAAEPALARFPVNLLCLNPRQAWRFRDEAPQGFLEDRYTIGMWWWELPGEVPIEWWNGFQLTDEVWAASQTVAEAVATISPVPVTRVRLPVRVAPLARAARAELGLPEGWLFLTMFDHDSTFARKNPLGAVEAFKSAFREGEGAKLVIHSVNSELHPDAHERLLVAAAGHADVEVLDGLLGALRKNQLLAACDCILSLHRAEGFGLPLAEAMWLGKPAIATGFSGNLEFMDEGNAYLVRHGIVDVGEAGGFYYPWGARWAEPDLEHAASLMRRVFEAPDEAREVGARAARHMRSQHDPVKAGRTMARRLAELQDHWSAPRARLPAAAAARARAWRLARRRASN